MTGAGIILAIVAAVGFEYYADPVRGDDGHDGRTAARAFRTLRRATAALKAGDVLNLATGAVFRESLMLPDGGTAVAPIVIRGNGAVVTGLEPIPDGEWIDQGQGVYHQPNAACWGALQPRVIDRGGRDVTVASGRRVTRDPTTLKPGEAIWNTKGIWYRAEGGRTPTGLRGTFRESGVKATGQSHVVVEGLVAERFANDGFNIHGSSHDLVFRNIESRGNGDDGFSVHEDGETRVEGGWFHHNKDGIADVHLSRTVYENVLVESNELFGVCFSGGEHTMCDSTVRANNGCGLIVERDRDHAKTTPEREELYRARVRFENTWFEGEGEERRIAKDATVEGLPVRTLSGWSVTAADALTWLYPDSTPETVTPVAALDVPSNGVFDVNLLLAGLTAGARVGLDDASCGGEWYRMVDVPVEENTGPVSMTECFKGVRSRNWKVTRRAPFRVYDALEPIDGGFVAKGQTEAVRYRLDRLPTGPSVLKLKVVHAGRAQVVQLSVRVHSVAVPSADDRGFRYTNWFSFENMARRHGLELWGEAHFAMIEKYVRLAVRGGQDTAWIPVGSVFELQDGEPVLDEARFRRIVETYVRAGIRFFEGGHLARHTGGRNESPTFSTVLSDRITTTPEGEHELAETGRRLAAAAKACGVAGRWYQHIADEPMPQNAETYLKTCAIVRRDLPAAKFLDAVCDVRALAGLDIATAKVNEWTGNRAVYDEFAAAHPAGVWCYVCCDPGGAWMNRLMDGELLRPTLLPWGCSRFRLGGFLHWGYNMYGARQNPFENSCLGGFGADRNETLPAGDTHIVYPGHDGPWPSVRQEAMRAGVEDCALLETLRKIDSVRADGLIGRLVRRFDDYSTNVAEYRTVRRELLMELAGEKE